MAFDREGALRDGYTDTEIANYLARDGRFDLASARREGYSDREIAAYLAGGPPFASTGGVGPVSRTTQPLPAPPRLHRTHLYRSLHRRPQIGRQGCGRPP